MDIESDCPLNNQSGHTEGLNFVPYSPCRDWADGMCQWFKPPIKVRELTDFITAHRDDKPLTTIKGKNKPTKEIQATPIVPKKSKSRGV